MGRKQSETWQDRLKNLVRCTEVGIRPATDRSLDFARRFDFLRYFGDDGKQSVTDERHSRGIKTRPILWELSITSKNNSSTDELDRFR